jgi:hypothetical protein
MKDFTQHIRFRRHVNSARCFKQIWKVGKVSKVGTYLPNWFKTPELLTCR